MQEHLANTIKALRKARGISQEQLANQCGVTVQAVSKWECAQSLPDITLLPVLADYFGVSIDRLLREGSAEPSAPVKDVPAAHGFLSVLPDDDRLRILWCRGQTVLYNDDYPTDPIPLRMPENMPSEPISFDILGNAHIEGAVIGNVTASDGISCGAIAGNASAGDSIECGDIGGNAAAGDGMTCGNVGGNAAAGDDLNCGDIGGNATAGDDIICGGDIGGNAYAGSDICSDSVNLR